MEWFTELWDKIEPYMNWEFLSKWIGYAAAAIALLCFIFALLAKCKNKKIAKFATKALGILKAVQGATAKAETYVNASGAQKKEIATAIVKNELAEAGIKASDEEISTAIHEDIVHSKEVNNTNGPLKSEESEERKGLEL